VDHGVGAGVGALSLVAPYLLRSEYGPHSEYPGP
jgi:hypothetical protein